jgi:hypothetical protein
MPTIPVVSPTGSEGQSLPTSWTWIWNCAHNSEQYQPETDDQYRQSNTNVSIRISSPGNDGAVTQTNIVISTPVSIPAVALPAITVTTPTIVVTTPPVGITIPPILVSASTVMESPPLVAQFGDSAITSGWEILVDEISEVAVANGAGPVSIVLADPLARFAPADAVTFEIGGPPTARRGTPSFASGLLDAYASGITASSGAAGASAPVKAQREPGRAKQASRWSTSPSAPDRNAPISPISGASASAAGVGGSSGGGLPIFLALPFIAALLDLARRVALERATWPSGHRRRVPDTPG